MTAEQVGVPAPHARKFAPADLVLVGIGGIGIVAGVALLIWFTLNPVGLASFGWSAYAPLSATAMVPGYHLEVAVWGGVLLGLGLAVLAFWAGLRVGRRGR